MRRGLVTVGPSCLVTRVGPGQPDSISPSISHPPPSAQKMTFHSNSRPRGPGRHSSPLVPFMPTGSAGGLRGQGQTHLVPDLLAQVLGLVQGEAGHQLCGQHEGAAELVHDLGHVEEGVVLQQLPGRGGTSGPGPRSSPPPHLPRVTPGDEGLSQVQCPAAWWPGHG